MSLPPVKHLHCWHGHIRRPWSEEQSGRNGRQSGSACTWCRCQRSGGMRAQGFQSGGGRCTRMCTLCRASTWRLHPCHQGHHGHQGLLRTRWRRRQSLEIRAMFFIKDIFKVNQYVILYSPTKARRAKNFILSRSVPDGGPRRSAFLGNRCRFYTQIQCRKIATLSKKRRGNTWMSSWSMSVTGFGQPSI